MNPSFPLSLREARTDLRRMGEDVIQLERPVVVLAGFFDPGIASWRTAEMLREATGDEDRVISIAFFSTRSFEGCQARVIDMIEKRFPSDDPQWTTEVDVVGISMGGVVGRLCAAPSMTEGGRDPATKRLRIRRLFTIGTPHRGADLARLPALDGRQVMMRAGSDLLAHLETAMANDTYEIVPYVRLGDTIVGTANTAPAGVTPWWVPNKAMEFAHMQAFDDPRIIADIARRLRGQTPWTTHPAAPLPEE